MRRSDKEIKDPETIESILTGSEICRLAITDDDAPYLVPLNYGYSKGILYFHSSSRGRKIDLLKKNKKVAFEIEYTDEIVKDPLPCNWTTRYRSVMGTGDIEIIEDRQGIKEGLDIIMSHYGGPTTTYDEAHLKRIVILRLTIEKITGKQSGEWNLNR